MLLFKLSLLLLCKDDIKKMLQPTRHISKITKKFEGIDFGEAWRFYVRQYPSLSVQDDNKQNNTTVPDRYYFFQMSP